MLIALCGGQEGIESKHPAIYGEHEKLAVTHSLDNNLLSASIF